MGKLAGSEAEVPDEVVILIGVEALAKLSNQMLRAKATSANVLLLIPRSITRFLSLQILCRTPSFSQVIVLTEGSLAPLHA